MDLPSLIRRADRGSLTKLAALSGGQISKAQWGEYRNGEFTNFPRPATIKAMARALGVTERTVLLACGEHLNLAVTDDQPLLASMLPTEVALLDDSAIKSVLSYVRLLIESAQQPATARGTRRTPSVPAVAFSQRVDTHATTSAAGGLRLV